MASESIHVEEPRERQKREENIKVYTRKIRKKPIEDEKLGKDVTTCDTANTIPLPITISSPVIGDNKDVIETNKENNESPQTLAAEDSLMCDTADTNLLTTSSGTIVDHSNELESNKQNNIFPRHSPKTISTEDVAMCDTSDTNIVNNSNEVETKKQDNFVPPQSPKTIDTEDVAMCDTADTDPSAFTTSYGTIGDNSNELETNKQDNLVSPQSPKTINTEDVAMCDTADTDPPAFTTSSVTIVDNSNELETEKQNNFVPRQSLKTIASKDDVMRDTADTDPPAFTPSSGTIVDNSIVLETNKQNNVLPRQSPKTSDTEDDGLRDTVDTGPPAITTSSGTIVDNNDELEIEKQNNFVRRQSPQTIATEDVDTNPPAITSCSVSIGDNNNVLETNKGNDVVLEQSTRILASELLNSSQQQQALSVSIESLSQNKQVEVLAPNGCVRANGNGALKPIFTKVDDRIRINLKTGRPKNEVRELKRKLVSELDQIRSIAKRLEDEEVLLSGRSTASGPGGYSHSQYSMNDGRALMRVYSDVGSVAQHGSRPFQPLSVSIMENHGVDEVAEKEKRTPKANQYYQNSEFLLSKDRLLPEGSNKKWKPYGGKRHGKRGAHRSGVEKYLSKAFKGCTDLLTRLMKHKHGWVFNKPVDVEALNLHDYKDVIKHPMDLGTVKTRLSKHLYNSPAEFAEDVKLTFHNAMTYNPKGHEVYGMAEELLKIFELKWPTIESDYNLALRYEMVQDMSLPTSTSRPPTSDLGLPTPTSRGPMSDMGLPTPTSRGPMPDMGLPTPTSRPRISDSRFLDRQESVSLMPYDPKVRSSAGGGRTPVPKKPKAKDPQKRDMTYEEKQKLSTNLQNLPSEKLNDIVQIIKKRNSAVSQHDDEIEVDIDSVDAETLWELDRFVSNFKKNISKKKRRAELALQARARAASSVPAGSSVPAIVKSLEQPKLGGESGAIPSSELGERKDDGAGRSSSSSSSSSGSGSSSSDTDSDSSSSNASDAGGSPKT